MKKLTLLTGIVVALMGTALTVRVAGGPSADPSTSQPTEVQTDDGEAGGDRPAGPVQRAHTDGTVQMDAALSQGWMPDGASRRLRAAFDLEAGEAASTRRPPLRVVLAIDRSGSMRGQKLEHVRRAAHTIVEMLEPGDSLGILSYASDVQVVHRPRPVGDGPRRRLHARIDTIAAGGGTHIAGGLRRAASLLEADGARGRGVDRIVLLSDGRPTVGPSRPAFLGRMASTARRDGTTVTTMGVGLDYNEEVMTRLANDGGGNYHFIEHPSRVSAMFRGELDSLAETVAREVELSVRLADGVELEDVKGFPHRREGDRVVVSMSAFSAGQSKSVFVVLRADPARPTVRPVLQARLRYRDLRVDRPVERAVALSVGVTDDAARIAASVDDEVIARLKQLEVAESLQRAMQAWEAGERRRAVETLERQRRRLQQARRKYRVNDSKFQEVEKELDDTAATVQRHRAGSRAGKRAIKAQKAKGNSILRDRSAF